jgi:DNA repair protein RAD5
MKFKKGLNSKKKNKTAIILLSLENAAAGTNLTEATHIFLVDPIKGSKEHVKATEDQAIGRAHRIGQENQVKIYRLIIKNTVEEQIFNECYKNTPEELSTELVESILSV